ncbi:MAG: ankyrin repeat domain-containing protein [Simkaniaceae bacterium]|nr:ankyrin repeat domain-containing protein [Candidatus Sacchlamyda saccharinae]
MSGILAIGSRICNQTPTLTAQVCADPSSQRLALAVAAGVITFTCLSASYAINRFQNRPIKDLTGDKLYAAAKAGNLALVKRYIAGGTGVNPTRGQRPLSAAAAAGHTGVVKVLHAAGADVNWKDTNQRSALHHAAAHGYAPIVEFLSHRGAEDTRKSPDSNGNTPAHLAAQAGSTLSLDRLVDSTPKFATNALGQNFQHLLAIQGMDYYKEAAMLALLPYLEVQDNKNNLPLHYAAEKAPIQVALSYLYGTKNPDVANAESLTPLHIAILSSRNSDKVIAFINSGRFDLDRPTGGTTPKTPLALAQESKLSKKDEIIRLIHAKLAQEQRSAGAAVAVLVTAPVIADAVAVPPSAGETPAGELVRVVREGGIGAGANLMLDRVAALAAVVRDPQRSVLRFLQSQQRQLPAPPPTDQ